MTQGETSRVLKVLLAANFAGAPKLPDDPAQARERSEQLVTAYHYALADVPYTAVDAALGECIRDLTFFPKPAEIRSRALANSPAPALPAWSYDADLARWVLGVCACGRPAEGIVMGKRLCLDHLHELALVQG